ncbi:MAG: hypothetical protein SFY67_00340 [Candidatus Melainabacteria bacterium]|nr:hypothetical protein [Candidatus Melainabacteria bacterium]
MKNKWAALAVCTVLLIASVAYYYYIQSRSNSDVVGIEKNWWDDPTTQEQKWAEQYKSSTLKPKKDPLEQEEENRDHYEDMIQLKATNSKRVVLIKRKLQELQTQLQNASSQAEADDLQREINKRREKLKNIREDDQFIQLITGQ